MKVSLLPMQGIAVPHQQERQEVQQHGLPIIWLARRSTAVTIVSRRNDGGPLLFIFVRETIEGFRNARQGQDVRVEIRVGWLLLSLQLDSNQAIIPNTRPKKPETSSANVFSIWVVTIFAQLVLACEWTTNCNLSKAKPTFYHVVVLVALILIQICRSSTFMLSCFSFF